MADSLPAISAQRRPLRTVLVCYTQAAFDEFEPHPSNYKSGGQIARLEVSRAAYTANLAHGLTAGLQSAGLAAEIVRLPQRSLQPDDIAKTAFAWRLLDLQESNGQPVDLLICLDFPAWSVRHSQKWVWLTGLPEFEQRSRPNFSRLPPTATCLHGYLPVENATDINGLLQSERCGFGEATRRLAESRSVAEEMARRGFIVEYHPLPSDLSLPPSDPQWQTVIRRLSNQAAGPQ